MPVSFWSNNLICKLRWQRYKVQISLPLEVTHIYASTPTKYYNNFFTLAQQLKLRELNLQGINCSFFLALSLSNLTNGIAETLRPLALNLMSSSQSVLMPQLWMFPRQYIWRLRSSLGFFWTTVIWPNKICNLPPIIIHKKGLTFLGVNL